MAHATCRFLPFVCVNHNTSWYMVYISHRHDVIGLTHGYEKKGQKASVISSCIWDGVWGGDLGTLIICFLSQLQMLLGWGTNLLEQPVPLPPWNHARFTIFTTGNTLVMAGLYQYVTFFTKLTLQFESEIYGCHRLYGQMMSWSCMASYKTNNWWNGSSPKSARFVSGQSLSPSLISVTQLEPASMHGHAQGHK